MGDKIQLAPEIERELSAIANDNTSGASLLFNRVLNTLPVIADELQKSEIDTKNFLLRLSKIIHNLQPCMAPFAQLSNYLRHIVESNFDLPVIQSVFAALPHSCARKLKKEKEIIVKYALESLKSFHKILVHSRSSLVESFLSQWLKEDRKREVWITESRPMCEGAMLAQALTNLPNRKVLLADDARGLALKHIDAVVIGADRISETYLVNKIGSHSLSLLAKEKKRPLFALAERMKFLPHEFELPAEPGHSGAEINTQLKDVKYFNYYFEPVELKYIHRIITSFGVCSRSKIVDIFQTGKWNAFAIEQAETGKQ